VKVVGSREGKTTRSVEKGDQEGESAHFDWKIKPMGVTRKGKSGKSKV